MTAGRSRQLKFQNGGCELNPFDIKSVLLAKHAQHVVLIHFPIALFIAGVGFDIMAPMEEEQHSGCG